MIRVRERCRLRRCLIAIVWFALAAPSSFGAAGGKAILRIAYSDWPGWVAWDIAVEKKWFKEAGVDARLYWEDYARSIALFSKGRVEAVCMTNFDALVTGGGGKPSKGILINDYSNGNDMIVTRDGIDSVKELKGMKVGLEVGLLEELLLRKALERNGLSPDDVEVVNVPTAKTPMALGLGKVDAIVAWQPSSGQALKESPGSKAVFTSADAPGLIYDMLFVSEESLKAHPEEWRKVVEVWFRVVEYMNDPKNKDEALRILSKRAGLTPKEYEPLLGGTFLLDLDGNKEAYRDGDGLDSVFGSSRAADRLNVEAGAYSAPLDIGSHIYPDIVASME